MKRITDSTNVDKSGNALTLPENGAISQNPDTRTVASVTGEAKAISFLYDFDEWAKVTYDRALIDSNTLDRLLSHTTPETLEKTVKAGALRAFPFWNCKEETGTMLFEIEDGVDDLASELVELMETGATSVQLSLARFLALSLLRSQCVQLADELREAAFLARDDKQARDDRPLYFDLFSRYLAYSDRSAELREAGLTVGDVIEVGELIKRDATYFASVFEEDVVRLYDEKRDRLAVVTRRLPRHERPHITDEEVNADRTLGLVVRHWEREEKPTWDALQSEKAQLEAWLATPGLEKFYWWSRGIEQGLTIGRGDECDPIKPTLALLLDHWREEGVAGDEITVDAIFEAYFKDDDE